jgi:tRNA-specific 2-thiouridylase
VHGAFRFGELVAFTKRAGAARLATGHYARIVEREGRLLVARAADPHKDQSYMLATVDPGLLAGLWFPLGDQTKVETRLEAAAAGMAAAERAESQEACFLAGDDYRSFLGRHGLAATDGPLLDEQGLEVGRHDGFWRFTPGQRRGLGVAAAEPLYALRTEAATNTVVVGPRAALARRRVTVRGRLHLPLERGEAKLRYRSPAVEREVQVVVYDGDAVIGAGVITSAQDT